MLLDIRLQWRNGFYYATLIVLVLWAVLSTLLTLPRLDWLLPGLLLGNLLVNTFYFLGGLILLEKGEQTLAAQIVTPLQIRDYLGSKLLTLTGLALLENIVLTAVVAGLHFNGLFLTAGLALAALLFCLAGFLVVIRYDAINEYLLPSMLYTSLLLLPLFSYFASWDHWLLWLHPMQGPLLLLQAAWQMVPVGQLLWAVGHSLLWIGGLYWLAERAFHRFVVETPR
jgi:fluoroquinolone transport system permease protein